MPPLQGAGFGEHAGTIDGCGIALAEGAEKTGQTLGGILAVAMKQGDIVIAAFDGVAVADFLIAAVALIHRD